MTRALAYARRALTRERKRAFHKMSSNVPSAPSRVAVAEALFVPSVPIFPPAWGAEVVSSNVVGYKKLTLTPGYNMIGSGFVQVGSNDAEFALQDLFQGTDVANATAGGGADEGDLIKLWVNGGYNTQYYFYTSGGQYGPDYDDKWYDVFNDSEPTTDSIPMGSGFWYYSQGTKAVELTTAGEVSKNSVEITINPGFNCVVYPFPADFDFTKLDWKTAGATAGGGADEGDLIKLWVNGGYNTQYYFYTSGGQYGPDYDDKWYDVFNDSEPTTATIPAGSGFWYYHQGNSSFKITLPSPIAE